MTDEYQRFASSPHLFWLWPLHLSPLQGLLKQWTQTGYNFATTILSGSGHPPTYSSLPGIEFHHFCLCRKVKAPFWFLGRILPLGSWRNEVTTPPSLLPHLASWICRSGLPTWAAKSPRSPRNRPTSCFLAALTICSMAWQTVSGTQSGKVERPHRWGQSPAVWRPSSCQRDYRLNLLGHWWINTPPINSEHQAQALDYSAPNNFRVCSPFPWPKKSTLTLSPKSTSHTWVMPHCP